MKTAYISMDVESFYDTTCVQKLNAVPSESYDCAKEVEKFLDLLSEEGIKATFFVNAEFAKRCEKSLKRAIELGGEIAVHSLKHISPVEQRAEEFAKDLDEAKKLLEEKFGAVPIGYRAPCFGLSEDKLAEVKKRFRYDSSVLDFKSAKGSGNLTLEGYKSINAAFYQKDGFYEYPIIRGRIFDKKIPISGGGYVRLIPWAIIKRAIFKHIENSDGYTFYVHPFEISDNKLPKIKGLKLHEKLFLEIGRRNYLKKIRIIIKKLKECGYTFKTMGSELPQGGE